MSTHPLPTLPLRPSSPKVSRAAHAAVVAVDVRQVPVLSVQLAAPTLAARVAHFPLQLSPMRAAYLPPATRAALRLPASADLLIEARVPELLGPAPLAQWALGADEVAALARANASSGALVVQVEGRSRKAAPMRLPLTPYWLDWQGWTGVAHHLATAAPPPDGATLRFLAWELEQRHAEAPSGLHTARAQLLAALGETEAAAAACQDEIALGLVDGAPTIGALDALTLLGQLLRANDEPDEAQAALSLALWLNPNHAAALLELVPLLDEETPLLDTLTRLHAMPQRPPRLAEALAQAAATLGQPRGTLEAKVASQSRRAGHALFQTPPAWLDEGSPRPWLRTLGL